MNGHRVVTIFRRKYFVRFSGVVFNQGNNFKIEFLELSIFML